MPDIFLSYSRTDQATARLFAEALQREGFSVWWDQTLRSGDNYDQVTEKALQEAKAVIVLWSKASVDSRWVRAEATSANRSDRLAPVMIEACERPIMFELKHTADLAHWKGNTADPVWRAYVEDVQRFIHAGEASPPAKAVATPLTLPPKPGLTGHRKRIAIGACAVLLLTGLVWIVLRVTGVAPQVAVAPSRPRLCVLPLTSRSEGVESTSFADGLHELLLTLLANRAPGMDVLSSTTMNTFRGKSLPVTEYAKAPISCTHVLEGAVFREDRQIRLIVQLIETKTDRHIWAQSYDRQLVKAMTLQAEVADEVAGQLSARLSGAPVAVALTANPEAFDLFVRALGELNVSRPYMESVQAAVGLLNRAIDLDAHFGPAYLLRASIGTPESSVADLETARKLMGNTPQVRAIAAGIAFSRSGYDATPAVRELEGAGPEAEHDPMYLNAKGEYLLLAGRIYEALGFLQRQVALDPSNAGLLFLYAGALEAARKPAEALRVYDQIRQLPGAANLAELRRSLLLLSYTGRTESLRSALERHKAQLPAEVGLGYEYDAMRFEHRYAELSQLLQQAPVDAVIWPLLFSNYPRSVNELRGRTALLAGNKQAASLAGKALLQQPVLSNYRAQGEGERAIRENVLALGELLTGNKPQAVRYMRSRELARSQPGEKNLGVWSNPLMQLTDLYMAATIYAWAGEEARAVELLEDLSVREAGIGPADVTRDPLFTVPLAKNARYQLLVKKLEAQMAANPLQ